jgi:ABC-type Mn2+/Zn2+ transport system ATPase subunit
MRTLLLCYCLAAGQILLLNQLQAFRPGFYSVIAPSKSKLQRSMKLSEKKKEKGGGGITQRTSTTVQGLASLYDLKKLLIPPEKPHRHLMSVDKLTKFTDDSKTATFFQNINLRIDSESRIGIIGSNSAAKTALLNVMAGVDKSVDGFVTSAKNISVGFLPQNPIITEQLAIDCINVGIKRGQLLIKQYNEISSKGLSYMHDPETMKRMLDQLDEIDKEVVLRNITEFELLRKTMMKELHCPPTQTRIDSLSVEDKRRVALARLFVENHDLLLLDDPSSIVSGPIQFAYLIFFSLCCFVCSPSFLSCFSLVSFSSFYSIYSFLPISASFLLPFHFLYCFFSFLSLVLLVGSGWFCVASVSSSRLLWSGGDGL